MPSKNLRTLNNGWHLSDAPMGKPFRFEIRRATIEGIRKSRLVMVCSGGCGRGIFVLTDNDPAALANYTVDLAFLKARLVDHWLKAHADELADQTYC
jgi:hypothetical protein